jgi:V8-like Glu-specific endopeptidase
MARRDNGERTSAPVGPGWVASALMIAVLAGAALTPAAHGAARVAVRLVSAMQATPRKAAPVPSVKPTGTPFDGPAAVGALFSLTGSGRLGTHFCTASVVRSPHQNLILTAAHCVTGRAGTIAFVPGYTEGKSPYGIWTVSQVIKDQAWSSSSDPDDDFAFLVVSKKGSRRPIQAITGAETLRTGKPAKLPVQVIGYPDNEGRPVTCQGVTTVPFPHQLQFDCGAYYDGTSGGPFLTDVNPDTGDGVVVGVIGGYQLGGDLPQISYAAAFGANIAALYRTAVGQS